MNRYHLARDGRTLGVRDEAEVAAGLASGDLRGEDLSWIDGEPAWVPLGRRPWAAGFIPVAVGPALERAGRPWPRRLLPTLREVLLAPTRAFAPGKAAPPIRPALLWHVTLATVANLVGLLWAEWLLRPYWELGQVLSQGILPAWSDAFVFLVAWALSTPLLVLGGAFVAVPGLHLLLRLVGAGGSGWRATLRVANYIGGAVHFLLAIPLVGFVAGPWGAGCAVLGLASAHRVSPARILAAALVGCLLLLGAAILALAMVWFAFAT